MNKIYVHRLNGISKLNLVTGGLVGMTAVAGGVLVGGATVSADVDDVSIIVPVSCTMTSSGTTSHDAEINNGVYVDEIGTTTLKVVCNDNAGFSIYAAGYTGNEIGGTNSTKLVGQTNSGLIATGTATSGNNSAWAMKLTTDPTATYPITGVLKKLQQCSKVEICLIKEN